MCMLRNLRKCDKESHPAICSGLAALWLVCEAPSRRLELVRIALKDTLFVIYNLLRCKGWIPVIPFGEVILFCISMSYFMYAYQNNEPMGLLRTVFNVCFGKM
eukprot:TRINITY_DN2830_c0_g1_i2.p1 TRINITY_DN2830_c0_g1~~TRINITY_DN2830_c0_g1_i2.p1  ORF type:complete len:103 (-),score=2.83 TRINITY_DN2830_c0_g1_i2:444-752(-)